MSTTAQEIFNSTMAIADEMSVGIGQINEADTESYLFRTPSILTVIQIPFIGTDQITPITSMDDVVQVPDNLALGLLPYMLGLELFKEENEKLYKYFTEMVVMLKRYQFARTQAVESQITNVY